MPSKITLEKYFKRAEKEKWAIGQFNFSDFKILEAIVLAAKEMHSPVILGTSEGESKAVGLKRAVALVQSFREETGLPLFLNLDHGKSSGYIKKAVDAGYDSVHFDGSGLSLTQNIKETQKIKNYAKRFGVLVEGEIDIIGKDLTEPKDAERFMRATKIDSLAVNIGTRHGTGRKLGTNFQRLAEIKRKLKNIPLVLHGGSGVPASHIKKAVRAGIVKININTELRMAYTNTLKEALKEGEITPYKYMPKVVGAVQKVVENKIQLFGSKNKWLK